MMSFGFECGIGREQLVYSCTSVTAPMFKMFMVFNSGAGSGAHDTGCFMAQNC